METRRMSASMHRSLSDIENDLSIGPMRLDEAVCELVDADRADDVATLLAWRGAPVPEADVAVILGALDDRCAAMLCRVMGLSANSYSALLRMRRRLRGANPRDPAALLSAYRDLGKVDSVELAEQVREIMASANG